MKPKSRSTRKLAMRSPIKTAPTRRKKSDRILFFIGGRSQDDDSDDQSKRSKTAKVKQKTDNPQLELILKHAPYYEDCMPLPYELFIKIFNFLVDLSDNPIRDLCSVARVCETWRQMVLNAPSLWRRIDLTKIPITTRNLDCLRRIYANNFRHIREIALHGDIECKTDVTSQFIEGIMSAPNLKNFSINSAQKGAGVVTRALLKSRSLQSLSITDSRMLLVNQKWFNDYLVENGSQLRMLDLSLSTSSLPTVLIKLLFSGACPNLKILDISAYDTVCTRSFDVVQLARNLTGLEVLRVGNVSFKRVYETPEEKNLTQLRELSMPIGVRDADRDDALFATLTFGSNDMKSLDLRGSSITAHALLDLPSYGLRELHMDDLCPIARKEYHLVISKWSSTLEILSLVKINCSRTMGQCLNALHENNMTPLIRDIDLSSSDIMADDLKAFLKSAKHLKTINLTSCRSLPRGCKGLYSRNPSDKATQTLQKLKSKLS